jgi:hypothetical protein
MKGGSKVLANDAEMAKTMTPVLQKLLGDKGVMTEMPMLMGLLIAPDLLEPAEKGEREST